MAKKNEKTSKKLASAAAKLLNDPDSPAEVKSVAASALTQAADRRQSAAKKLKLLVGVNFRADGEAEETRIEAGPIDEGVLPPKFEAVLREKKKLVDA